MIKKRHFTLVVLCLITTINFNYTPPVSGDVGTSQLLLKSVALKMTLQAELSIIDSILNIDTQRYKFHGNILIGFKDQIIYEESFGYANPIHNMELTSHDEFELASVSKQFTAAAVLQLYENDLIDLDASLSEYFPDFKHSEVTVRHLLKHTSGLYNYMHLTEKYWKQEIGPSNSEVIDLINTHEKYLNTSAGSVYKYSNTGYVLLAALVEKVSGQTFESYLAEYIFEPAGMLHTYVNNGEKEHDNLLDGYIPYHRYYLNKVKSKHNTALGDKGVCATSSDLFNWMVALKNEKIVSQSSLNLMFNTGLATAKRSSYGMGFRTIKKDEDQTRIYHNGLWDGFRTGIAYYPSSELVVIVLNHTQCRGKGIIQRKLEKMALEVLN